jgi:carbon-monoxide dehydrogenase medium subunit
VARTSTGVRVAVTGAAPCVFRAKSIEAALSEKFASEVLTSIRVPAKGLNADMHGDADYRAHLIGVLARRAVDRALATSGKR